MSHLVFFYKGYEISYSRATKLLRQGRNISICCMGEMTIQIQRQFLAMTSSLNKYPTLE